MESVDIRGMLQNMLDQQGLTLLSSINEIIQNMLSAGATTLVIRLIGNSLYFVDNGRGMTLEKLRESYVLHKRSEATSEKHGRFGIGLKNAIAMLTKNKGDALTISRTDIPPIRPNMVEISYSTAIETGVLTIHPHQVSVDALELWDQYSIDKDRPGTLQRFDGDPSIIDEFRKSIDSKDYSTNIQVQLGNKYHKILSGVSITIMDGDKEYPISSMDPLLRESRDKITRDIRVMEGNGTIYFSFEHNGKPTIHKMNPETGKRKYEEVPSLPVIANIHVESTYSNDWVALRTPILSKMGVTLPENKKVARKMLGGIFIHRNGIGIETFSLDEPSNGDEAARPIHVDTHTCVNFEASARMDDLFKVRTNKSRLDEESLHPDLRDAIDCIHKDFVKVNYKNVKAQAPKPTQASTPRTPPVPPGPATPRTVPVPPGPATPRTVPVPPGPATPRPAAASSTPRPVAASSTPRPVAASATPRLTIQVSTSMPTGIRFTHNDTEIIIHRGCDIICNVNHGGQYDLWHNVIHQTLTKVGTTKFLEWIHELQKANRLLV